MHISGNSTYMRTAHVICRLSSRRGLEYYRRLAEELPKRGVRIEAAHVVRRRKKLKKRIRQAVKAKAPLIIVIGGDGTQTAAVAEMVHSESALAVVPSGTGNSFAYSLGIKDDIESAVDTIVDGHVIQVDAGRVNDTYFANFSTIGLIAEAANRTPRALKKITGPIAYGVAAIVPLLRRKPFKLRVRWKGGDLTLHTHQAIVASGRYYGHQPLVPQADIRSGMLAFFAAEDRNVTDALATNAALLRGDQTTLERAHYFTARKLRITADPAQPVNIDGHDFGKTPITYRVARKALRIMVPADFTEQP